MPDISATSIYREPTVMWHLQHDDGRVAHGVIVSRGSKASAIWFVRGSPQDTRDFNTWHGAIRWLERVLVKLQMTGWCLRA